MGDLNFELRAVDGSYSLISKYNNPVSQAESFKAECIKAAQALVQKNKNRGLILFLENTFESLVMLEAFLETGAKFETAALSCGQLTSPVVAKWQSRLTELGLKLHEVRFDYENPKHIAELETLQKEFEVFNVMSLFNMWAASHFDQFTVFSGEFCLPQLDVSNKVSSWGLPSKYHLALFDFSKMFYLEPFFLASTHGLARSQAESEVSAALIELQAVNERGFGPGMFAAKKVFYENSGFEKLKSWPVTEAFASLWQAGLRFEDRDPQENIARILDKTRGIKKAGLTDQSEININEPDYRKLGSAGYKKILAELVKRSSDLNTSGAALPFALEGDAGQDQAFAMFPYLMLQSTYPQDVAPVREHVKKLEFFHNFKNMISSKDLHLRPEFSGLVEFFEEKVRKYFETQGKLVRDFEITQCWANQAKASESHHLHRHPNCLVSGIFYLDEGCGGDTVFTKALPESEVVFLTQRAHTPFNVLSVKVRPKPGKLVLFPSYIAHEVLNHQNTEEPRYTVAFNVFVRDSIGSFTAGSWLDLRKP